MAARGNPSGQDLSSAVPLSGGRQASPVLCGISQVLRQGTPGTALASAAAASDHSDMVLRASVQLLLEQRVIERDWAASMIANLYGAIDYIEGYIGSGNTKYFLLAILVVILVLLARRRR